MSEDGGKPKINRPLPSTSPPPEETGKGGYDVPPGDPVTPEPVPNPDGDQHKDVPNRSNGHGN